MVTGLVTGLSALGTGILSGFSSDKKKKRLTIEDLLNSGYEFYDADEEIKQNERTASSLIENTKRNENAKNTSLGIVTNPNQWSKVSQIYDRLSTANEKAIERETEEKRQLKNYLAKYNLSVDEYNENLPGFFDKFLQGAMYGAGLGVQAESLGVFKSTGGSVSPIDYLANLKNNNMNLLDQAYSNNNMPQNMPPEGIQPSGPVPGQEQMPGSSQTILGIPVQNLVNMSKEQLINLLYMVDQSLQQVKPNPNDTVPAMLSPGEKVMNPEAVRMAGGSLDALNMQGLNQRNGTGFQTKSEYTLDELKEIQTSNPEMFKYIMDQISMNNITVKF